MSSHDNHSQCCGGGSCAPKPEEKNGDCCGSCEPSRRDFLFMTAGAMGAVAAGSVAWPFIDQLNPAADTKAMSTTEVDVASVSEGQAITVMWRGKPVFIRHRTAEEIDTAKKVDVAELRDKQSDEERFKTNPKWLVVVGVCTHLGCVPLGQKTGEMKGDYNGWFCPCHGSAYDTSGRIRKGPAPKNLEVPSYSFISDTVIRIG
jgi:ubiquinol-cytochrome c reductase iron-sulfur subunit